MPTTSRRGVYFWTTWLTPALCGDAQCLWAPWFQGHYTFDKLERGGLDLETWKVEHAAMVDAAAAAYRRDGWTVTLEDQNKFSLRGAAATVAGKPDLVAVRGDEARVVDCKSGKRRGSDIQQVLLYMFALPLSMPAVQGKRLAGELQYRDGPLTIRPDEFTPELRARIVDTIKRLAACEPPPRVPSTRECAWCDIGPADCPDRLETPQAEVAVSEW